MKLVLKKFALQTAGHIRHEYREGFMVIGKNIDKVLWVFTTAHAKD